MQSQYKTLAEASVTKDKQEKTCDISDKNECNQDSDNESIEQKRSENIDSLIETSDNKNTEDVLEKDSAKLFNEKLSETEAATKNVELQMEESKSSDKIVETKVMEKSSDIEECDSANVSREAEDAVQALQVAEQGDGEVKGNSPDSCEQGRDHLTPELSVSGPSPPSQPCISECISDTNSDVPAPLTPQVHTPPPIQDNSSPQLGSVPSVPTSSPSASKPSPIKSDIIKHDIDEEAKKANSHTMDDEGSTSDDDIPSDDNYPDDYNESPPGAPAPSVTVLQPPPPQHVPVQPSPVQQSPIHPSPLQQSPIHPSPVQQSPIHPSPIQQSPIQQSPIQHSPVQKSPIQPCQPSPIQKSPALQKQPDSVKSFHEAQFTEEIPNNFDQLSNSSSTNIQAETLPQPHYESSCFTSITKSE